MVARPLCAALLVAAARGLALLPRAPSAVAAVDAAAGLTYEAGPVRDVVYHLHIPKVGGISFGLDASEVLQNRGLKQASREGCFSWQDQNPRVLGTALLLRSPRKHVLSMYDFCLTGQKIAYRDVVRPQGAAPMPGSFEGWLDAWRQLQDSGWHGDFTPPTGRVNFTDSMETWVRSWRVSAWSRPPFSPEGVFLDEKDWLSLDGGGTIWHFLKVPFQCYSPLNFQTQRLSCQKAMDFPAKPHLDVALDRLGSAWFVGILEQYQASICLLHAKLGEALPPYCDCRRPELWKTFSGKEENIQEHRTDFKSLSKDTLRKIDEMTLADRALYKAGVQRFVREVREVEARHGTKLLCNFTAPA